MDWIKRTFFNFMDWLVKTIGKIKAPWVNELLHGDEVDEVRYIAQQGDFLIVRATGWLASLFLGRFSHCAYVYDSENIVDSTGIGVAKRSISNVLIGYGRVAIVRPNFTKAEFKKMHARVNEILKLDKITPIEYNYSLVSGNKKVKVPTNLTCAQLLRDITNSGRSDYMGLRKRFGFESITPSDYYDAKSKFKLIMEIKK